MNLIKKFILNILGSRTFHLSGRESLQIILICGFVLIGTVSYLSQNSFHISKASVDEIHTTKMMLMRLHGENEFELRVPESGRILGFIFHPLALYYMNTKMGGEVFTEGWDYPRDYLWQNVVSKKQPYTKLHIDPNVQDYAFALRVQQNVLLMASFLFAGLALLSFSGLLSSIVYLTAGLSSSLIFHEALIFYNDVHLVIAFNLIIGFLFHAQFVWFKRVAYLTIAFAFGATTKMSLALLAPLVWFKIFQEFSANRKTHVFELTAFSFTFSILVYFLLSIGVSSWVLLVSEQLANVWHYGTGHRVTQPSGLYQIKRNLFAIPNFTWLVFAIAVPLSIFRFRVLDWNLAIIFGSAATVLLALSSSHFFMARNVLLLELLIILYSSIVIGKSLRHYNVKGPLPFVAAIAVLIIFSGHNLNRSKIFDVSRFEVLTKSCSTTLSIGAGKHLGEGIDEFKIQTPFRLKDKVEIWKKKVNEYECVYVFRSGQYKQFSNYILPQTHNLQERHGNHFFFRK